MPKLSKLVITFGLVLAATFSSRADTWVDSALAALRGNQAGRWQELLASRESAGNIAGDFAAMARSLQASPVADVPYQALFNCMEPLLARGLHDRTLSQYLTEAGDAANPIRVREILVRMILSGSHVLGATSLQTVKQSMLQMAQSRSTPLALRAFVLKSLGSYPAELDARTLLPFLSSAESPVRSAAFQAVARRARTARANGTQAANRELFDSLKVASGDSLDLDEVKALGAFSEGYSRDYLLTKCAGSPERMEAIFRSDDDLAHPGLVKEAIRLSASSGQAQRMRNAIRYGLKDPDGAATALLAGQDAEVEAGLKLLALYPEHVRSHASEVQEHVDSPEAGIRDASMALFPFLTTEGN